MKELWNKFIAWFSGWPESKEESKKEKEQIYLFAEEEELKKKAKKKVKGLNPKKKKGKK